MSPFGSNALVRCGRFFEKYSSIDLINEIDNSRIRLRIEKSKYGMGLFPLE